MENEEEPTRDTGDVAAALRAMIGSNVRDLREEVSGRRVEVGEEKFTQAVLAKELTERGHRVTDGQIGHIESGRKFPSMPLLVALADYFETSLDFIVGRTTNKSSIAEIDEDLQTGGISGRLGDIYKRLPPTRQEEIYRFAEALEILTQSEESAPSPETVRFVHALIGSFSKRLSIRIVESDLDLLAREFPSLAPSFINNSKSSKKKRGQS